MTIKPIEIFDTDTIPPVPGERLLVAGPGDAEYHEAQRLGDIWQWTDRRRPPIPLKESTWMYLPTKEDQTP